MSIAIAFLLDAWWDRSKDRAEEQLLLASLQEELLVNVEALEDSERVARTSLRAATTLLAMTGPDALAQGAREVDSLLIASTRLSSFDPSTGTLSQILKLDGLRLIRSESLRRELASWEEQLRDYREDETRAVEETFRDLFPLVRARLPGLGLQDQEAWSDWGSESERTALLQDLEFANTMGEKVYRLEILLSEAEELRMLMGRMLGILEQESL